MCRQLREMGLMLRAAHEENLQLREELRIIKNDEGEGRFLSRDEGQQPVPPGPAHGVNQGRAHGQGGCEGVEDMNDQFYATSRRGHPQTRRWSSCGRSLMLTEVGEWYQRHLAMSSLDRANHHPTTPQSVQDKKWRRLWRRLAGLINLKGGSRRTARRSGGEEAYECLWDLDLSTDRVPAWGLR